MSAPTLGHKPPCAMLDGSEVCTCEWGPIDVAVAAALREGGDA